MQKKESRSGGGKCIEYFKYLIVQNNHYPCKASPYQARLNFCPNLRNLRIENFKYMVVKKAVGK